ncbi:hypothetical protein BV22DRAFT_75860 [Leucogyrophana mollusca]|uniref:Uncharacterized protein n=1 Tax=Leucogyrophana mollusca TaxID=85980 RepID=A0ACB8BXY4_9AGAM|nr:hypothetical protein BV22DRAFT_75860 [Leucogyrophana mollusca]
MLVYYPRMACTCISLGIPLPIECTGPELPVISFPLAPLPRKGRIWHLGSAAGQRFPNLGVRLVRTDFWVTLFVPAPQTVGSKMNQTEPDISGNALPALLGQEFVVSRVQGCPTIAVRDGSLEIIDLRNPE